VLTPRARADLKAIWIYTADRWNVAQADRYA
jgi:plasmid stabilization system protein ParE